MVKKKLSEEELKKVTGGASNDNPSEDKAKIYDGTSTDAGSGKDYTANAHKNHATGITITGAK